MKLPADRNIVKAAALCALVVGGVAVAAPPNGPAADYPVVVGAPYQAGGATFTPADTMNYDIVGYASASAGDSAGEGVSAAHHTLPVPSYVEVTDLASGRTILVRITSRGPMDGANAIALSPAAMAQLGLVAGGPQVAVRVRRVNPPEAERALLRAGALSRRPSDGVDPLPGGLPAARCAFAHAQARSLSDFGPPRSRTRLLRP